MPTLFRPFLVATLVLLPGLPGARQVAFEARLAELSDALEHARREAHVPGMSIAVVRDDEVVFARGWGLADVEAERAADEHTVYAVGSTTKAFTAALVGMLVDEGELDWDDPVTEYLPYFDLQVRSEDEGAVCTLRDLLSHRHGFSRMSMLWLSPEVTREEILRVAAGAEPWDDFRTSFHYCNVTYLAAGVAAGVAAGTTWDELMRERLLEPLEMSSSTLSVSDAGPELAVGYSWEETAGRLEPERLVALDAIGPAGSLNADVLDMAQWVRLQLAKGVRDGERLISEESFLETWSPQVSMGGGSSYGLGWMLHERNGHRLVEHGGNIGGFSAQVGMAPDEGLGYVLLMNLSAAPLQQRSLGLVFDALLGERVGDSGSEDVAAVEAGAADLPTYLGVYVANFATFRDEEFEVRETESGLALHIPSQQTFDLKAPDDRGRWGFVLTDQIEVSFERDGRGEVTGLTIHQNGFDFLVPREGRSVGTGVPAEELEKYVGSYVHEGGKTVEVALVQGGLAFLDGNEMLPLRSPDETGHARMRARADLGATFVLDERGDVLALDWHNREAEPKRFDRVQAASRAELPSVEELLRLRKQDERTAALSVSGGTRIEGQVRIPQAGLEGTLTTYTRGADAHALHLDFGKFGRIDLATRDGRAWSYNPMTGLEELAGHERMQALLEHPSSIEGDWTEYYDDVAVLRTETLEGRPVHVVRLTKGDFPPRTCWVDAETGDVVRLEQVMVEGSIRIPVTLVYSEFEDFGGLRRATRVVSENPATGRTELRFEEIETGLDLPDERFQLTEPDSTKR